MSPRAWRLIGDGAFGALVFLVASLPWWRMGLALVVAGIAIVANYLEGSASAERIMRRVWGLPGPKGGDR